MIDRGPGTRHQLRTTIAVLAGVLLVGFVVGSLAARAAGSAVSDHVSTDDYIVLVAQLYERERSVFNAQERLEKQGITSPANTVANLAATYRLERPSATRDIANLEELAQALRRLDAETTATAPPSSQSARGESGGPSLLLILVLFLALLTGAGIAANRALGVNVFELLTQRLGALRQSRQGTSSRPRPSWGSIGRTSNGYSSRRPQPAARSEPIRPASFDPLEDEEPDLDLDLDDDSLSTPPAVRASRTVASAPASRIATPTSTPQRRMPSPLPRGHYRLRFSYEIDDDDYEELHPIRERGTDRLLGTCCVGAALRRESDGGVYAFTAWIQDYASQELRSIGLVTSWARSEEGDTVDRWIDEAVIDETLVIDRNASVQLDTQNLSVVLTIADVELLPDDPNPPVARLITRFDVVHRQVAISVNGR